VFVWPTPWMKSANGITHVFAAEEAPSNTPTQQLLWEAFGGGAPVEGPPVIVNEDAARSCPSAADKWRWGTTSRRAYLGGARQYLMLMGWGPRRGVEIRRTDRPAATFGWRT